jgi:HEAT repeat protein
MPKDIASLIWAVNYCIAGLVIVLSLAVFFFAGWRQSLIRRHETRVRRVMRRLAILSLQGEGALRQSCPAVVRGVSAAEFLMLSRERESLAGPEHGEQIRECLNEVSAGRSLEKDAARRRPKWRRIEALVSLGYSQSPKAQELLSLAVHDRDPEVAYYAMFSLAQLKTPEAAALLLECLHLRLAGGGKIASFLEGFPEQVLDEVLRASESTDPYVRFWAVRLMRRFPSARCLDTLLRLSGDVSADVRAAVCESLAALKDPSVMETLRPRMYDVAWFVRMHAIRAAFALGGEAVLPEVIGHMRDEHWMVRQAVKEVMVALPEASLPQVESLLDAEPFACRECVQILEDTGWIRKALLAAADPEAPGKWKELLRHVGKTGEGRFHIERVLRSLDPHVQPKAERALKEFFSS